MVSGASHPGVSGGHRAEASLLTAAPMSASAQSRNTDLARSAAGQAPGRPHAVSLARAGPVGQQQPVVHRKRLDDSRRGFALAAVHAAVRQRFAGRAGAAGPAGPRRARASWTWWPTTRGRSSGSSARATAIGSTPISPASASWKSGWSNPKPGSIGPSRKVDVAQPVDIGNPNDFVGRQRLMSDMVRLALATDSSRFITLHFGGSGGVVPIPGRRGRLPLAQPSRPGRREARAARAGRNEIVRAWGDFLRDLAEHRRPRRQPARSHRGAADQQPGQRLEPRQPQHARALRRRRLPPRPAPGLRPQEQLPAAQPVPVGAAADGLEQSRFATSTGTMTGLEMV